MLRVYSIKPGLRTFGAYTGVVEVVVRFGGCCLACSDCHLPADARIQTGTEMNVSALLDRLHPFRGNVMHLRLAGGEPLLQPQSYLVALLKDVLSRDWGFQTVTVSTSGAMSIEGIQAIRSTSVLRFSVSYKPPSTGMTSRMVFKNYSFLRPCDEIRVKCLTEEDLSDATGFLLGVPKTATPGPCLSWEAWTPQMFVAISKFILDDSNRMRQYFDMRLVGDCGVR